MARACSKAAPPFARMDRRHGPAGVPEVDRYRYMPPRPFPTATLGNDAEVKNPMTFSNGSPNGKLSSMTTSCVIDCAPAYRSGQMVSARQTNSRACIHVVPRWLCNFGRMMVLTWQLWYLRGKLAAQRTRVKRSLRLLAERCGRSFEAFWAKTPPRTAVDLGGAMYWFGLA
jgi:hypothetical protein